MRAGRAVLPCPSGPESVEYAVELERIIFSASMSGRGRKDHTFYSIPPGSIRFFVGHGKVPACDAWYLPEKLNCLIEKPKPPVLLVGPGFAKQVAWW